jgi:hypothetical protein
MSKAANKTRLEELHDLLATEMTKILRNGKTVLVDGEARTVSTDAATLSAIRQFLKDNSIEAPAGGTPAINELAQAVTALPFGADPRDTTPGSAGKAH